jgi:WD40 repeat protein
MTISPNSKTLTSVSLDKTVKLWDVGSGALLQTLESHLNFIRIITFSINGKTLMSLSFNVIIKL